MQINIIYLDIDYFGNGGTNKRFYDIWTFQFFSEFWWFQNRAYVYMPLKKHFLILSVLPPFSNIG